MLLDARRRHAFGLASEMDEANVRDSWMSELSNHKHRRRVHEEDSSHSRHPIEAEIYAKRCKTGANRQVSVARPRHTTYERRGVRSSTAERENQTARFLK